MRTCLIGVDIGTQGTKTGVYLSDGTCLTTSFEPSALLHPEPGVTIQDADVILESVCRTIKAAVAQSGIVDGEVVAIGVDAQMAGILGVDEDGLAVTPYDSWLDTRCMPFVRVMKERAEEEIIRRTGGQVTVNHGAKILWWKEERPEYYKRIVRFVTLSAYVGMRLCGLSADKAYIDDTHLHFTGFANNIARCWDDSLLAEFRIEKDKMPRLCRPTDCIGVLTREMAQCCGLQEGIPIAAGCGDTAASSLGAGILSSGEIYDVAGSASIFSYTTESYLPDVHDKTLMFTRSVKENLWNALAYISGGGLCLQWYQKLSGYDYVELDGMAEQIRPGSGGLLFVPHFSGRTCPNEPKIRGSWLGLDWQKGVPELYRSIMESIACEYKLYLDILMRADSSIHPTEVCGVGGGSLSKVFNQIKADVLQIPYRPLECCDTAVWGSAITAGVACGLFDKALDVAGNRSYRSDTECLPHEENRVLYQKLVQQYRHLLKDISCLYETIF